MSMDLHVNNRSSVVHGPEPVLPAPERTGTDAEKSRSARLGNPLRTAGAQVRTWATAATLLAGDVLGGLVLYVVLHSVAQGMGDGIAALLPIVAASVPLLLLAYGVSGFYRPRLVHPALEMKEMAWVTAMIGGTATLVSAAVAESLGTTLLVAVAAGGATILLPASRVIARLLFARLPWWGLPTVVASFGEHGKAIVDTLNKWPEMGLRPVAWLEKDGSAKQSDLVHGDPQKAPYLARTFDIPCVITSMPEQSHGGRAKRLTHYSKFFDRVFNLGCADAPALWTTGDQGRGFRGYGVCNAASGSVGGALKRAIDILGASVLLLLGAPLFTTIAALIWFDSEGPVLYRQERVGAKGKIFTILKFRSMYVDADERLSEVLENDPQRRREYEKYHKLQDDPRVTPIGRILRQYSLDELPQLLNVLRGDMSLIGPRAYLPSELPRMKGLETVILQTPPGITGLWQVSGRNRLEFKERVDLDVHYVQNWSFWLDCYLLLRTIPTVLTGEGSA